MINVGPYKWADIIQLINYKIINSFDVNTV